MPAITICGQPMEDNRTARPTIHKEAILKLKI